MLTKLLWEEAARDARANGRAYDLLVNPSCYWCRPGWPCPDCHCGHRYY